MISELDLVSTIRKMAAAQRRLPGLVKGIGDDCAILRPRPNHDLVFTTDLVLEGRHFTLDTHKPADIGHKALARSLSDLAAMGSKPLFCLIALAVPSTNAKRFIQGFYQGLIRLANQYGVSVAGGDLASSETIVADVLCCGEIPTGKSLLRSSARAGDAIYVSGVLGAAAAGFEAGRGINFRRHLRPEPRIELGRALRGWGVSCCMDISDGLALDLYRLCEASGVGADLGSVLPVARGASVAQALTGGEDYELLFTAPEKVVIPDSFEGVPLTRVGKIRRSAKPLLTYSGKHLHPGGFDHFV